MDTIGRIQLEIRCAIVSTEPVACAGIQIQSTAEIGKSDRSPSLSAASSLARRFHPTVLSIISYAGLPPIRRGSCHSAGRSGINTSLSYHISTYKSISHVSSMWSHHRGDSSTSIRSRAKRIARHFSHQSGTILLREKNSRFIR